MKTTILVVISGVNIFVLSLTSYLWLLTAFNYQKIDLLLGQMESGRTANAFFMASLFSVIAVIYGMVTVVGFYTTFRSKKSGMLS